MKSLLSYEEIIADLESRGMMPERPPGLEVTIKGLERIGYTQFPFWKKYQADPSRVIVVAGTNGKGSVCATLQALLSEAGETVGLYTSPHLVDTTERIRIGDRDISREEFCKVYHLVSEKTKDLRLSHFEMLTLMAVYYFCSGEIPGPYFGRTVDRMILEVGLGGSWDATNVVPHGVSVITTLGLDHQEILGKTLIEIAQNKFGIIPQVDRQEMPNQDSAHAPLVVHAPFPEEISDFVQKFKEKNPARWVERTPYRYEAKPGQSPSFSVETKWGKISLILPGDRGAMNVALALTVFDALGYSPGKHLGGIRKTRWPGRMEKTGNTQRGVPIYVSGDHNPQGVESLLELLPYYYTDKIYLLLGVGAKKDLDGMMQKITLQQKALNIQIFLTMTPFQGRGEDEYAHWRDCAENFFESPEEALNKISEIAPLGSLILISGSLYLVGTVKKCNAKKIL